MSDIIMMKEAALLTFASLHVTESIFVILLRISFSFSILIVHDYFGWWNNTIQLLCRPGDSNLFIAKLSECRRSSQEHFFAGMS